MKITVPKDCRTCGLCCIPGKRDDETYVEIEGEDRDRLRPHERSHLQDEYPVSISFCHGLYWKIRTWPDKEFGRKCYFLKGRPGKRCSCSIYERRPAICQMFARGGDECLEILEFYQKGYR